MIRYSYCKGLQCARGLIFIKWTKDHYFEPKTNTDWWTRTHHNSNWWNHFVPQVNYFCCASAHFAHAISSLFGHDHVWLIISLKWKSIRLKDSWCGPFCKSIHIESRKPKAEVCWVLKLFIYFYSTIQIRVGLSMEAKEQRSKRVCEWVKLENDFGKFKTFYGIRHTAWKWRCHKRWWLFK